MMNSELVEHLSKLPTDKSHVSVPAWLIEAAIAGLMDDIYIVAESGDEIARIEGEMAEYIRHSAVEQYILDMITHGLSDSPLERLRGIAEFGWGRLSQRETHYLLSLVERKPEPIGTVTMGGESYDIVKAASDET